MTIREAQPADLDHILRIQQAAPEASAWSAEDWEGILERRREECAWVAVEDRPIAFLLCRVTDCGADGVEAETLNIAVAPESRRRGAAEALLVSFLENHDGEVFLEVRASNVPAISLYRKLGFVEIGLRPSYYHSPVENALVMRSTINFGKRQPKSH